MTDELEIKFLKFADGELAPEEEACVLLDCEESPQQWKHLALALVSQRRLSEALADFDTHSPTTEEQNQPAHRRIRLTESSGESRWHSAARLAGMTLALVLAFFVGRQQTGSPLPVAVDSRPSATLQQLDEPYSPPAVAASQSDHTPRQRYSGVDPWTVVSKPVFTEQDRSVFSEAGLDVEEENTIYIVNDANGGRWAIPWKAVNVRYAPTKMQSQE